MTTPLDIETELRARDEGELHRRTGHGWMAYFLRVGIPHRIVPRELWSCEVGLTIGQAAELRCQCGALHVLRLGAYPQSCVCPRWFFFDGTDVWALCSPVSG